MWLEPTTTPKNDKHTNKNERKPAKKWGALFVKTHPNSCHTVRSLHSAFKTLKTQRKSVYGTFSKRKTTMTQQIDMKEQKRIRRAKKSLDR
jgi:hypothetical protein